MKVNYTTLLVAMLLASTSTLNAQNGSTDRGISFKQRHVPMHQAQHPISHASQREVIWSDDFSTPGNWVIGTEAGRDADEWVIGTQGPTGTFSSTYGVLGSTTASNGFALFDSDLACGGNQETWVRTAAPIDLTDYAGAILQFEQLFTRFRGDCYVDLSRDGVQWTEIEVNAEIDPNDSSENPDLRQVNISAFGGESTVWIRFRYFSTVEDHGPGGGCDYAWMVDDVALVTLPDYDIVTNFGYVSQTGDGEEYGRVPSSQWQPVLNIGAEVMNFGSQWQTNVVVDIECLDVDGIPVFQTQHPIGDLSGTDTTFTEGTATLESPGLGLYTTTFTVTSDQSPFDETPENNTAARTFEVTTHVYSLDNIGNHPTGQQALQQVGTFSFESNPENVKFLNYYVIRNTMMATGIEVALGSSSDPGTSIVVSILDTADVFANPTNVNSPLIESPPHVVTQAEITAGKATIEFFEPYELSPNAYYAVASLYSNGDDHVYLLDDRTVPQPNAASMLWLPFDPENNQNLYGGNGNAWAVRLTSDPSIGIRGAEALDDVSIYPNPTTGPLRIHTASTGKYYIEILDRIGRVVHQSSFNGQEMIDITGLAPGVYMFRVSDGERVRTQRVTLAQ